MLTLPSEGLWPVNPGLLWSLVSYLSGPQHHHYQCCSTNWFLDCYQLAPSVGRLFYNFLLLDKKLMVRTRSRATSPGRQGSRDASSNPYRDRQSASVMQTSSVQHVQSMAAAMAELTMLTITFYALGDGSEDWIDFYPFFFFFVCLFVFFFSCTMLATSSIDFLGTITCMIDLSKTLDRLIKKIKLLNRSLPFNIP